MTEGGRGKLQLRWRVRCGTCHHALQRFAPPTGSPAGAALLRQAQDRPLALRLPLKGGVIGVKKSPLRDEPQRGLVFVSSLHPLLLRERAGVRDLLR